MRWPSTLDPARQLVTAACGFNIGVPRRFERKPPVRAAVRDSSGWAMVERESLGTNDSLTTALITISETRAEVLSNPERRRRWSVEQKLAMVAEMMQPGRRLAWSRRHGIRTGLIYSWRRQAIRGDLSPAPTFVPVQTTEKRPRTLSPPERASEISNLHEDGDDTRVSSVACPRNHFCYNSLEIPI